MTNYEKQLERVRRFLKRVKNNGNPISQVDYEDDLWAFFIFAWALKDYIKHFVKEYGKIDFDIEKIFREYNSLKICGELANKEKHWKLKPGEARHFKTDVFIDIYSDVGCEPPLVTYYHTIQDKEKNEYNVVSLAEEIVGNWQDVIIRLETILKK
jgi:hypothetical protein